MLFRQRPFGYTVKNKGRFPDLLDTPVLRKVVRAWMSSHPGDDSKQIIRQESFERQSPEQKYVLKTLV